MTLEVDTEALRAHAGDVDYISQQLEGALDAGATTALATDAFGIICSFLVPFTTTVQLAGVAALVAASQTTSGIASGLRSTADAYDEVDDLSNGGLTALITRLTS
ncbi:type VII secretion target [Sanguibacter sp. 25GB23B1]|uniref:type VII secretion target n=1 Tax=unclassified Sanguibacter TaxID=2645534 RepID=UPI0032AEDA2B